MNWTSMTPQQQHDTLMVMQERGGSFVSALASAWMLADSANSYALARTFPDIINRYGPGTVWQPSKEPYLD